MIKSWFAVKGIFKIGNRGGFNLDAPSKFWRAWIPEKNGGNWPGSLNRVGSPGPLGMSMRAGKRIQRTRLCGLMGVV